MKKVIFTATVKRTNAPSLRITVFEDGSVEVVVEPPR
jgi:hypothetical protein